MTTFMTAGAQAFIDTIVAACGQTHANWGAIFARTYADTLTNTLKDDGPNRLFVLTGDIPAMWQRDATAQIRPYLVPAQSDAALADVIERVVNRLMMNMAADPYANAFNQTANGAGHQSDAADMHPLLWERKYELDSLCFPAQLAYLLWQNTGRTRHFNATFEAAVAQLMATIRLEQNHARSAYRFIRTQDHPEDTLPNDGRGTPVGETGMSWSGFRPSDDRATYGYSIPANLFAAQTLRQLATVYIEVLNQPVGAQALLDLAAELTVGVQRFGVVKNAAGDAIYAYEVDGLGHALVMDDANMPSLLALPYLGAVAHDDPVYAATRRTILSAENPYYFTGPAGAGIGSPHTPVDHIWPIALAVEGLTTPDRARQAELLDIMADAAGTTGVMHESFAVADPTHYTREWFSWANMMFCELVMHYFGYDVKA